MIERDDCTFAMAMLTSIIGLPLRQTMRVVSVLGIRSRISSSMATLSCSARTTMRWFRLLALACTISEMIVKICGDQPRITVWSFSRTREWPLRSSSSLPCRPALMMPINVATMKMPPRVTVSIASTNMTLPESPPIVPGSRVRSKLRQTISGKSNAWVIGFSRSVPDSTTAKDTARMNSSDRKNRPTISAIVPLDM